MSKVIPPGSKIGIIGGGQLGRMTAQAAARLGFHCHIYTPEEDSPAAQVSAYSTVAPYDDMLALSSFAESVDVITFEFENIPHESLVILEEIADVAPSSSLLKISQNRTVEKEFINNLGVGTAQYKAVHSLYELKEAVSAIGFPSVLKTATMGYDGKGQIKITKDNHDDLQNVWQSLESSDAILEAFVPFAKEISVIIARNLSGDVAIYPPVENVHKNHILDTTLAPADISQSTAEKAIAMAKEIAEGAGLAGLLAIEMFVLKNGELLVNEIAPRPHNSGHWSMDGANISQFEMLVRAICNLPLGEIEILHPTRMKNLIGNDVNEWMDYLKMPNASLHLYGKTEAREGRKMGHVNFDNTI